MSEQRSDLLCWIDLEMTGLDPSRHAIIEIATLLTDNDLQVVAEGPEIIIHAEDVYLSRMIDIVRKMHTKSGLVERVKASVTNVADAERETLVFLKQHCNPKKVPLCGNSIWCDRMFLKLHMPGIDDFLHYRTIDVSSFKEVATRWHVRSISGAPRKGDKHRALDDIKESIAELKHYRDAWLAPWRNKDAKDGQDGKAGAGSSGSAPAGHAGPSGVEAPRGDGSGAAAPGPAGDKAG